MVYVIIVNWNGWRDTIECLESVFRSDHPSFRVVVCDNGSQDGSLEHIKAWAGDRLNSFVPVGGSLRHLSWPPVAKPVTCVEYEREEAEEGGAAGTDAPLVLIRNGANLGFAGANNVGLRHVLAARQDFDFVWLLNNDTVIRPDALSRLVERMRGDAGAGMCGSTLLLYDHPEKVQAMGGGWYCKWIGLPWHFGRFGKMSSPVNRRKAEARMNYVEGASMLVSRPFLVDIGLMCEDYFLYFEETDWAIRANGRYALMYAPESVVYHKVGSSIGTSSKPWEKSLTCDYYNIRNRLFFTRKFYPFALPAIYAVLCGTVLVRLLLGQWDRVVMIMRILADHDACPASALSTRPGERW
jgi:GT2 family glycosyltransferase